MARRREVNPIDVVEAAYDIDVDDRAWLTNLATRVRPLLEGGVGTLSYLFDIRTPVTHWYENGVQLGMAGDLLPLIMETAREQAVIATKVHVDFAGLLVMNELVKRFAKVGVDASIESMPALARYYAHAKIVDYAALQTVEPGGCGVVFTAGQKAMRTYDRRTVALWAHVNAHIAAGRRLRAAVRAGNGGAEEAVLTTTGKVEHAEGDGKPAAARTALREAVVRQEKARGRARREDPVAATTAWTAMVSGRWSLVDRFERGGRRYIVARRNEHALPDPRGLTLRERAIAHLAALGKPNKLIAYELGLAESTVGSHLSTIMRKLGVASRVELIQLVASLAIPNS